MSRSLLAWLVSPTVRRLRAGLEAERRFRVAVDAQLAECRTIVADISRFAGGVAVDGELVACREECARLRRLCAAQEDLLAAYEGRPLQVDLQPIRYTPLPADRPRKLVDS